jgi:single-strand DNA-binding protein
VARFRFATTEKGYTLQNGTQVPDRTDWHNVILWRRLAEIVERYVHKGDKLYIEGRLRYSTYDNKQGQRQYVTEIWADNMEMLSAKPTGQQEQPATASQTTATDTTSESSQSDALPF